MRLADYIAQFLIDRGVQDIFMLTGYGAMYLNDAIEVSGINYYATRNEATAPMMAEAYARVKHSLGVVCVTAGPGATNAIPGLAEAYVDSAPILIISGQVDKRHTTHCSGVNIRTFGTAEIDIIPIVKPLTKFAAFVDDPSQIRYFLQKAMYFAKEGRPGPVWLDIPLDVQQAEIHTDCLAEFVPSPVTYLPNAKKIDESLELLMSAKRPLLVYGQGVRQSDAINEAKEFMEKLGVPVIFSRLGQDSISHSHPNVLGHGGIKGFRKCKDIMKQADVVLCVGCRLAVQFVGHDFEAFENAKVIMVDIDIAELNKPGCTIHLPVHSDAYYFIKTLLYRLNKKKIPDWSEWLSKCQKTVRDNPMILESHKTNPIDLYYFMERLGSLSGENHILVTDAGSNYYAGGQVWKFEHGQREITSGTNAAMGTTIPLAIGASIASPKSQILAVTGDGSLELNIQELKTISHYKLNLKLFVINNGGYASMRKWQDSVFDGRRIDTEQETGAGTLNLKKVAEAFDLRHVIIERYQDIDDSLRQIMEDDSPVFVEVVTTHNQKIVESFNDHD